MGMAASVKSLSLFGVYLVVMGSRFGSCLLANSQAVRVKETSGLMVRSAASAGMYLLCAFLSVLIPFPRLHVPIGVFDGDGLWETNPERAIAVGILYFAVMAYVEFRIVKYQLDPPGQTPALMKVRWQ